MKLKKKYCNLIDLDKGYSNQLLANKCEKIADEFAIGFLAWSDNLDMKDWDNKTKKKTITSL